MLNGFIAWQSYGFDFGYFENLFRQQNGTVEAINPFE